MTNGEKFKEIFGVSQVDEGVLYAFAWLPNHNAAEFCIDWWNAEYNEPVIRDNGVKDELNRVKNELEPTTKNEAKYCDRNICLKNEYNNIGCEDCEVTKSQEPTTKNNLAVDCIVDVLGSYTDLDIPYKREIAENILTKLPSVTPQQPKGYWIDTNDNGFVYHRIYKCSHCGATVCEYPENMHESKYKYCSNCGSRNEVEE